MSVKMGDKSAVVKTIQTNLNAKTDRPSGMALLVTDGDFGSNTLQMLYVFQIQKSLPVTNIVDAATAVKLGMYPSDVAAPSTKLSSPFSAPSSTTSAPAKASGSSFFEKNKNYIYIATGLAVVTAIALAIPTNKKPSMK